jgi:hypothetical protein
LRTAPPVRLRATCWEATRANNASFFIFGAAIILVILAAGERTITVAGITTGCDPRARRACRQKDFRRISAAVIFGCEQGERLDQQLKQLMKELGEAINGSLSDSEQIAEVVARIKEGGYDIFLVLEATIGVRKQGEESSDKTLVSTLSTNPELKISDQDLKFLKSLRIKLDEEEEE